MKKDEVKIDCDLEFFHMSKYVCGVGFQFVQNKK